MFDKMKNMANQFQLFQELMKDDNFKAFVSHPKVRGVFMEPEFQQIVRERNMSKMMAHPKFAELMRDPEVAQLMMKLKGSHLFKGGFGS